MRSRKHEQFSVDLEGVPTIAPELHEVLSRGHEPSDALVEASAESIEIAKRAIRERHLHQKIARAARHDRHNRANRESDA